VNRSGIIAVSLNEGDGLVGVVSSSGEDHILLSTRNGMAIRFSEDDARVMGRDTAGVRGIELADGDEVVGVVRVDDSRSLLTVTSRGYGKRTQFAQYLVQSEDGSTRAQSRGGKGRIDIQTTEKNGHVVAVLPIAVDDSVVVVSEGGMLVRVPAGEIREIGRNTQGVRVVRLKEGDKVVGVASAPMEPADASTEPPPADGDAPDAPPAAGEGA
jgi:DNA gyrase subunit A